MLLDAHQQWTLAKLLARRARSLPVGDARDRAMARAMAMSMLSQFQRKNPADSRTAKTPCPPETLAEMGFSPATVATLTRNAPPLV
jgi:hypothetical protein